MEEEAMRHDLMSRSWLQRAAGCALILLLAGCAQPPAAPAAPAAISAVPGGGARIWFYRDYEPSVSRNLAEVSLNGSVTGYVQPDGSPFYRDVPPGRYHVTVASGGTDVNQDKEVDLPPGQEAFVKILDTNAWESSGDQDVYSRDTFYVSLVPPQVARAELATHSRSGG
jgi:hypothetical protein